jgi:DNA-binding response OmpR family regulator
VPDSPARTALVVDDDPLACELLRAFLRKSGVADVKVVLDVSSALSFLREVDWRVDILCCDLNMPEMDGVEFLGQLRDCAFGGLVIVVSGASAPVVAAAAALARAYGLSVAGTFKKPVDFKSLGAAINATVRSAAPRP